MAIPFNVEDDSDYEEIVLQQLFSDLCQTLQQITEIQRSRRTQNLNTNRVVELMYEDLLLRDHAARSGVQGRPRDARFSSTTRFKNTASTRVTIEPTSSTQVSEYAIHQHRNIIVHSSVSTNSSRRSREHGQPSEFSETLLNSAVNLALSPAGSQNELETFLQPETLSLPVRRLHRRRSQSEPPFCEEVKPVKVSVSVEVTNKDWIQQEQPPESSTKKKWRRSENLLSKLVPAPFSAPLWTAVICMVGWHLLRTR